MPTTQRPHPYSPHLIAGLILAALVIITTVGFSAYLIATRHEREALALLNSPDPQDRRRGAWQAATEDAPDAIPLVASLLAEETDAGLQEAYIYTLGRRGRPRDFDALARFATQAEDPFVRQAAWVACARLDPDRFAKLAVQTSTPNTAWDQIGLTYGWLEIGQVRDIDRLFHWAVHGEPNERRSACAVLQRRVAPLLEIAGHWPLYGDDQIPTDDPWPPEFVAEIARRCDERDLQTIADDTWPHIDRLEDVRRYAGKLLRARERLAWLLLGD